LKRRAASLNNQNARIGFQTVSVQDCAALRTDIGKQVLESDYVRSVLAGRVGETPKDLRIKEYRRPIPATHSCVVDCILEI
jgi:hypothetical protein